MEVAEGSCLATVVGNEPFEVNSLHRQAVGRLGNGMITEAEAEDGTIEAASVKDSAGYVLATQCTRNTGCRRTARRRSCLPLSVMPSGPIASNAWVCNQPQPSVAISNVRPSRKTMAAPTISIVR